MEPHVTPSRRGDLRALVVALAVLGLFVAGFAAFGATSNDDGDKVDLTQGADDGGGGSGDASSKLVLRPESADEHDMEHGHGDEHSMEHAEGDHDAHHDDADHDDAHQHDAVNAQPASNPPATTNSCDTAVTTAPTTTTTDGHAHSHGETTTPPTTVAASCNPSTTVATTIAPDNATTTTTHGEHNHTEPPTGPTVPGETTTTTPGHHHPPEVYAQIADLPPDVQYQIGAMTQWAMHYDTTAKATAGGFPKLTQYFPGIAAHYINLGRLFDNQPFDWSKPEVLLFNGTDANAQLVGFNYIVRGGPNNTPPAGFPGDFDGWHEHPVLCMKNGIVVGEVGQGQTCPAGQTTLPFQNMWLLHVWAIPGWESPEGIFSHENSRV